MNKGKLFIENMLIYGVGGAISKILPIIMVPIITRLLPDTTYYGLSDLCSTMLSFGSAIAVMGMYDAIFRMFFEKEKDIENQKKVCSTGILITIFFSIIVFILMILLRTQIAQFVFKNQEYTYLVVFSAIGAAITSTNTIVSAPIRMQNRRKVYLIVNTLSPCLAYMVAIPLILKGFFIVAIPIATIVADACIIIINTLINRSWF